MNSKDKTSFINPPLIRLGDYIKRSTQNNRDLKYGIELIEGVTNEGIFASPKGNPMDVIDADLFCHFIFHLFTQSP